jgi:hypothetical protein
MSVEMSDSIVVLPAPPAEEHEEVERQPEPEPEQVAPAAAVVERPRRVRPAWLATATVGAVALIASGALGYDAYAASRQRDDLYARLVSTTATLGATQSDLASTRATAASNKVIADYAAMYVADSGKAQTDYWALINCDGFGACRTSSQQLLEDLQAFQADRKAADVPSSLTASDSSLGDSLSAAIAADQEIIAGMDTDSSAKFDDGFTKLDAAMLSMAKAEATLGAELK